MSTCDTTGDAIYILNFNKICITKTLFNIISTLNLSYKISALLLRLFRCMLLQKNSFAKLFCIVKTSLFALMLISSLSACAQKAVHTITYSNSKDIDTRGMTKDILYYINQDRASIDLPALQLINEASSEATKHSAEMANRTTAFGHDGFDERIDNVVKKIGIVHASAENVAYGKLTAKEVVDLWLNSPGHKKNIEGNYALTGIGVAKDADGIVFYTQIFLRK